MNENFLWKLPLCKPGYDTTNAPLNVLVNTTTPIVLNNSRIPTNPTGEVGFLLSHRRSPLKFLEEKSAMVRWANKGDGIRGASPRVGGKLRTP
ncbi:hypothetical protein HCG51_34240 (plasmid) [Tolypothrix sp. PCC 7910]|uniref:hypothetical protein n=1 Tax=Tolypothrix sp. PCC 7910 TaxID=2099387 RepID=UPI001427A089|nr:hypothetical protein [Tolypothrix sp. PCC 7910]QIR41748.1 hypothetical protein HCG51_34240 [Tolypothrix sp. PCC 7910]